MPNYDTLRLPESVTLLDAFRVPEDAILLIYTNQLTARISAVYLDHDVNVLIQIWMNIK